MDFEKVSIALDELASLFESGSLQIATDPAEFIYRVCEEIKYLRLKIVRLYEEGKSE